MTFSRRLHLPRLFRVAIASTSAAFMALIPACRDSTTEPVQQRIVAPTDRASFDIEPPQGGSVEFTVGYEAPLAGNQQYIGHYPYLTVMAMSVHQHFGITVLPPFPPGTGELGLAGRVSAWGCSHQGEAYLVSYYDGGGYSYAFSGCQLAGEPTRTTYSDTVQVLGTVKYGYTWDSACPYPDYGCAAYSGSSGIALSPLHADLAITSDTLHDGALWVWPRQEYSVTAAPEPARMGKYPTPVLPTGSAWSFKPDSGAEQTDVCLYGGGRSCDVAFTKSGFLTLTALVNGEMKRSSPLRIETPRLSLSLSDTSVNVGDTIIVTTTVRGADSTMLTGYYVGILASQHSADPSQPQPAQLQSGNAPTETDGSAPSLLPCVGTKPVRTRCFIVMSVPGKVLVGVSGSINRVYFGAFQNVIVNGNDVRFESVTARGPNPNGSFTTRAPENLVTLEAHVTPVSLASQVQWTVEDDPSDEVASVAPASPPAPGGVSSFTVPKGTESESRWPKSHPGTLRQKAIAYKVTASIVLNGKTYSSAPVTVKQDEYDVLRQEYIDYNKKGRLSRAELGSDGDRQRNSGDYSIWPSPPALVKGMAALQQLAREVWGRPLTVNGGFRNPVHHHKHIGGRQVPESSHLYGLATDFNVYDHPSGLTDSTYWARIGDLAHDDSVGGCFEPAVLIKRSAKFHNINHVHIDWRNTCPNTW